MEQSNTAKVFRDLHYDPEILILPNVWDIITARLIASLGFKALATASISVAAANGYPDGEKLPFHKLMNIVSGISGSVNLPVTVDMERGYANDINLLKSNINQLLDIGVVGINIEDCDLDHKGLIPITDQCKKIETIKNTALKRGIDLFVNARTDSYLFKREDNLKESINRAKAYQLAGADCIYPILINNYDDLIQLIQQIKLPINVALIKPIGDLKELEKIGVKRVSLGPGTLLYFLSKLKAMALDLKDYNSTSYFTENLLTIDDLAKLIT